MSAWSSSNQVIPPAASPSRATSSGGAAAPASSVYGPGFTGATGGGQAFSKIPSLNNPGGVAFWSGVSGVVFLVCLYHSLPR